MGGSRHQLLVINIVIIIIVVIIINLFQLANNIEYNIRVSMQNQ